MKAQFDGAPSKAFLALTDAGAKQTLQQHALGRRLRMDLVARPLVVDGELIFQRIDNTRADVAEGSYVVRKDPDLDTGAAHLTFPIVSRRPPRSRG